MKKTIYYSVQNCGDGSAYPIFFEDEICANLHQEIQEEKGDGWGESCTSSITLDISVECEIVSKDIKSKEKFLNELKSDLEFAQKYKEKNNILIYTKAISLLQE